MASKVHIICAKCGSDDIHFRIEKPTYPEDGEIGVSIICEDCGELTGVDEWNEFNGCGEYNPK